MFNISPLYSFFSRKSVQFYVNSGKKVGWGVVRSN